MITLRIGSPSSGFLINGPNKSVPSSNCPFGSHVLIFVGGYWVSLFLENGEHVHPLPARGEDELGVVVQTTTTAANIAAGSGLHDADCSAGLFIVEVDCNFSGLM